MNVAVVGIGNTRFARQSGPSAEELAREAVVAAIRDSGLDPRRISAAYVGAAYETNGLGQRILKELGLTGGSISNLENACASGSDAVIHAARMVALGEADVALALGLDAPTRIASTGVLPLAGNDPLVEFGVTAPALYALRARQYLDEWGGTVRELASVAVKNRWHGSLNPAACFREPVTLDQVLNSPPIADPLTRLQCCPVADGAAAVVLARPGVGTPRAWIRGYAMRSGLPQDQAGARDTITSRTSTAAFEAASVDPKDLDFCEVHDAFTIGELLAIEGMGVVAAGEAARYVESGKAHLGGGGVVVNPSGGLLARGHPPGATGVIQVVEATRQLARQAGERQVEGARMGACHTRGGGSFDLEANACAVIVIGR